MKVKLDDAGPCRKVLDISAPAEEVAPVYREVRDGYVREARLPGFRKGRAPERMVEKRFSAEISGDTKDRIIPRLYRDALKEKTIDPVAIVEVGEVNFALDKGIAFKVTVDVAPEFNLPKYQKISVKPAKIDVDEKQVDESLKSLLKSLSRFTDVPPRPAIKGDLVQVDYVGTIDGRPVRDLVKEYAGLGEAREFWMLLEEPELLPGMAEALAGAVPGEEKNVRVKFPAEHRVAELAGKEAQYRVTIRSIRERVMPVVDEDFLKQFDVASMDELRGKVRSGIQARAQKADDDRMRGEIAVFLLKKTDFDLPQKIVEQERNLTLRSMFDRFARQGATREQMEKHKQAIYERAVQSSEEHVKLSYILSRIAREENVEVTDDEVNAAVADMAQEYQMEGTEFRAELEKRNAMERLRSDIREGKTMTFLLEAARKRQE